MSLRKRREAAAACAGLVIGALAEAFPRALSVCARRRVPTALGIYRALLVAVQAAIIAGTVTAKDLKTALRRYITSNGYLCACRQAGAARIASPQTQAGGRSVWLEGRELSDHTGYQHWFELAAAGWTHHPAAAR